ncbi:cytochrome c oxidase subunit II [Marinobacter segnicrescens]|uniref:cytochrome c oxidase subunit II n=1 Tax=Marinobacter segnicrescens TaxID=430453 RepID=UPI003A8D9161
MAITTPLLLGGCGGSLSALDPAGESARSAAWLWWAMLGLLGTIMLLVFAVWFIAVRRAPAKTESGARRAARWWIIGGGLVLPMTAIVLILGFGIPLGQRMLPLPVSDGEPLRINVTARQWQWQVNYPDSGIRLTDEVHIPANTPVDLHLTSDDVVHSFWVPRLGGKLDMIPGHTNVLRLQADQPGTYRGQCAEFCGTGHAHMKFRVQVHDQTAFQRWQQEVRE